MRYFFNGEGPVGRVQNMKGEREEKSTKPPPGSGPETVH